MEEDPNQNYYMRQGALDIAIRAMGCPIADPAALTQYAETVLSFLVPTPPPET